MVAISHIHEDHAEFLTRHNPLELLTQIYAKAHSAGQFLWLPGHNVGTWGKKSYVYGAVITDTKYEVFINRVRKQNTGIKHSLSFVIILTSFTKL